MVTIAVPANVWTTAGELVGVLMASYGLIRESFARLAAPRPYGEGRYGEGPYGGAPPPSIGRLVSFAVSARLLPRDGELTLTDQKRNAALAILGSVLVAISLVAELVLAVTGEG